jgi:hypothetical protein
MTNEAGAGCFSTEAAPAYFFRVSIQRCRVIGATAHKRPGQYSPPPKTVR